MFIDLTISSKFRDKALLKLDPFEIIAIEDNDSFSTVTMRNGIVFNVKETCEEIHKLVDEYDK